jgi:formate dehydrogenase maturation protein FdhE
MEWKECPVCGTEWLGSDTECPECEHDTQDDYEWEPDRAYEAGYAYACGYHD